MNKIKSIVIAALLIAGCSDKSIRKLDVADSNYYKAYMGNDILAAEHAAIDYRQMILDYQASGVRGLRYDIALSAVSAHLYALYEFEGKTNESEKYLVESVSYIRQSRGQGKAGPVTPEERHEVDNFLKALGSDKARWRTNWQPNVETNNINNVTH